jgi:hypothetical protein
MMADVKDGYLVGSLELMMVLYSQLLTARMTPLRLRQLLMPLDLLVL